MSQEWIAEKLVHEHQAEVARAFPRRPRQALRVPKLRRFRGLD